MSSLISAGTRFSSVIFKPLSFVKKKNKKKNFLEAFENKVVETPQIKQLHGIVQKSTEYYTYKESGI